MLDLNCYLCILSFVCTKFKKTFKKVSINMHLKMQQQFVWPLHTTQFQLHYMISHNNLHFYNIWFTHDTFENHSPILKWTTWMKSQTHYINIKIILLNENILFCIIVVSNSIFIYINILRQDYEPKLCCT